ncbi:MAG TPA: response regulator transcription factor, partial [Dehalococcoidia bacterium]|nr:response regulator transcription factor [Dehalococcoidia bacterium]
MPPTEVPIRVVLVDDHTLLREGTSRILREEGGFDIVGEAGSAEQAQDLIDLHRPDVLVLDIRLPGASGIDLARWVRRTVPSVRVLLLSGFDYDQYIRAAIRIGVHGYLLKNDSAQVVIEAVRAIASGQTVYPDRFTKRVMESFGSEVRHQPSGRAHLLTPREWDVVRLLAEGEKNADIAEVLHVSVKTVEKHITNIMEKLGTRSRTEAALLARRYL